MKRAVGIAVLATALLAGCATTRPDAATNWLIGTWLMMAADVEHPLACASGLPIRYGSDGRYTLFEGNGTWRLQGDRLTETGTEVDEAGDEGVPQVGRPYVSRIERIGTDEFRKTYADGHAETFRRCPPAP